jgi:predicted metal-binding protein
MQVLGLLESRNLSFETVVMMDLNESIVPQVPRIEALVPASILGELGLRPQSTEEEIQLYHFHALLAPAQFVHLIYARNDEHERSRFLERLIWEKQKKANMVMQVPVYSVRPSIGSAAVSPHIKKTVAMTQYLREKFIYSATSVNTYLHCPRRFFFRYLCGLTELDEPGGELAAVDIGKFVHELMEEACLPLVGKKPVIDDLFRKDFDALLRMRFARELEPRMPINGFLLEEVLLQRLERFLEREEERVADVACLTAVERECRGAVSAGGHSYNFTAKIDRVEQLIDGSVRIIDFKTGAIDPAGIRPAKLRAKNGNITRETVQNAVGSFQLYIYRELFARGLGGVAVDARLLSIRARGRGDEQGVGLFGKKAADEDRALILDTCREGLAFVLSEITDPAIPFISEHVDSRACAACPFYYACR